MILGIFLWIVLPTLLVALLCFAVVFIINYFSVRGGTGAQGKGMREVKHVVGANEAHRNTVCSGSASLCRHAPEEIVRNTERRVQLDRASELIGALEARR